MVWKPPKALGLGIGLVIVLTIIGIDAFLIRSMFGQSIGFNLYLIGLLFTISLPLLALWVYWYYGLLTLRYYLDRNALEIVCNTSRYVIPMDAIQRIVPGNEVVVAKGFRGVGWPGYLMGHLMLEGLGLMMVQSTEPLERQLVVVTDSLCYGISPSQAERFLEDFAARRALQPMRHITSSVEYAPFVAAPVWRDRWFWGIATLAILGCVALFGLIFRSYGQLPERIPLHFDARGQVDRIVAKSGFLVVPEIGALTLAINGLLALILHQHERLGAYLLISMAVVIQIVLWLATWGILGHY
jgi:hypothetical protein